MSHYDQYRVMNSKGEVVAVFRLKMDAIRYLKDQYRIVQDGMYIVDIKGNVVFD